jgi:hypothetical protein
MASAAMITVTEVLPAWANSALYSIGSNAEPSSYSFIARMATCEASSSDLTMLPGPIQALSSIQGISRRV